jgi:uncharacterized damage-inducible protein DinB
VDLPAYLRVQARANHLANRRLHEAMRRLPREDFHAPRTSFFPSLAQTLNHILEVDLFYIAVLYREANARAVFDRFVPADELTTLATRQAASDERLIEFCDRLDAAACDAVVEIPRSDHIQRDRTGHLLAHLFNHQTHHRGQAHAMLAGTAVAPPQLDEFMLPSEAHLRQAEMAALGWSEAAVYGGLPAKP